MTENFNMTIKNSSTLPYHWKYMPFLLVASLFLVSCAAPRGQDRLEAVLWYQHAGEARALYYQAYNIACDQLQTRINQMGPANKLAVIMDVDETVLNNSPLEADLIRKRQDFTPMAWDAWVKQCKAERLPGAVDFLNFAVSQGVEVFYITDRSASEYAATARNLKAQGFPMVDAAHLWPAEDSSGKEGRRQRVLAAGYTVLMLFGDSLPDFSTEFNETNSLDRIAAVDKARNEFGRKYIVLPNPMYGSWDRVMAGDAKRAGMGRRGDFLDLPLAPAPVLKQ
jgi:5'-nucleotidase (lipoprotein e(P4) family)